MSYLNDQKEKYQAIQTKVSQLLRITEEAYSMMLFEAAFKYIDTLEGKYSQEHIKAISQHFMFWNWWKNQYHIADEKFLNGLSNDPESLSTSKTEFEQLYHEVHSPKEIFIDKNVVRQILSQYDLIRS